MLVACCVLFCFVDSRVRKIRNKASSRPGSSSRTFRCYHAAISPSLTVKI